MARPLSISILIPTLNEGRIIEKSVADAKALRPPPLEIIVADGGSKDGTRERAAGSGARVVKSAPGRADQLNYAAKHAKGDTLLFLHADTRLPTDALTHVAHAINGTNVIAGAFRLEFEPPSATRRAFAGACNVAGRLFDAYGGHRAVFVRKDAFNTISGFNPDIAEETVDLTHRLRKIGNIAYVDAAVQTSARRIEQYGIPRVAWHYTTCAWASYRGHLRRRPEGEFYPEIR